MAAAETARLIAELTLKDKLTPGIKTATASLGKLETSLGKIGGIAKRGASEAVGNLAKIGAVAAVGIAAAVKTGIDDLAELESAVTSVEGAITQMGLTGAVTGRQIADWANEIESSIGAAFDDKAITSATATLVRFGKVTPDNIRPAMEVMTDLATKTGDVDSAASLLAKALADPTKAAGKLSRVGIVLTKQQQKQIKAFDAAGDSAAAQKVILDELARTTGGAALASQGKYQRALSVLADVSEDARKALAEGFLPVIEKVAKLLSTELAKPATMENIRQFGQGLAKGLDSLVEIARNLPWATIGDSLKLAGTGARAVLQAFTALPPWVQTAVLTGWGLNKLTGGALSDIVGELGKGLIKGVLGMTAGVVNLRAATVVGAPGGVPVTGGGGIANTIKGAVTFTILGAVTFEAFRQIADARDRVEAGGFTPGGPAQFGPRTAQQGKHLQEIRDKQAALLTTQKKVGDDTRAALLAEKQKIEAVRQQTATSGIMGANATTRGAGMIVGAVRANRPIVTTNVSVHVTAATVTRQVNVQARYGSGNGSSGRGPTEYDR